MMYSALLVRFVELFLTENLNPDMIQLLSTEKHLEGNFKKVRSGNTIYIYVVGGVTWGEVEGLKLLGEKLRLKLIVCTTEVTSGRKIIQKCFPAA